MLALCFLSKSLENQGSTTSGHQKMIPSHSFRLHLILGEEENTLQSQDVAGGRGVPDKPKRKPHTLWEEKVYACLHKETKQVEALEAAKNITTKLTNRHGYLSFSSLNLKSIQYRCESILMQEKASERLPQKRESLSLVSALTTLQMVQPLGQSEEICFCLHIIT